MIKKFFSALCLVLFATSMVAQLGLSCDDPIPVDDQYQGSITEPGEYWFTAYSYDLPMEVRFYPDAGKNSVSSPAVYVDFTCEPGVYDNPKLDSVINGLSDFNMELPFVFKCDRIEYQDGLFWILTINETYRENLARCGITENLQAFVRVVFPETGSIMMQPDTTYQSCMEDSYTVKLGDTIDIAAKDDDNVLVLPYSAWKNDSIQFTWIGEGYANVWLADMDCNFAPTTSSIYYLTHFPITSDMPHKLRPDDISNFIDAHEHGGVYFCKVVASHPGKLVIERIPLGPIQGGATLLKYGESVSLNPNEDQVFCFPKHWKGTVFSSPALRQMKMYVSNRPDFAASDEDDLVLASYSFFADEAGRALQLSTKDISQLAASASDDYLYVRFSGKEVTTLTPSLWDASVCANKSILIEPDVRYRIPARSSSVVYRMRYADWKGYDFTIKWTGNSRLPSYAGRTCDYTLSSSHADVLWYKSIAFRGSSTISKEDSDEWAAEINEEGFVYFRFNPTNQGYVTFTSSKPEDVEPEPTNDCVAISTKLTAGEKLTINLKSAFTVYCIKYEDWKEAGMTLTWTGAEPLHTFVADTCEFALAPYNKYVHAYIPVRAEEDMVVDLEALAGYVDEAGYLYIRFLTEFEGELTIK